MKIDLKNLTIKEAIEAIKNSKFSASELVKQTFELIDEQEENINAFISLNYENAIEKAKIIDEKIKKGEKVGLLAGIPYSVKDVFNVEGLRTTAGSKILKNHISLYTATVVQRLENEDAILIGKTNCDPFGFGSSTEHSYYGVTKNPVDNSRVPGGSSGGSAAAVGIGAGLFSIAEDTGGSIRCPASFCGLVGLKPTYGRVSRYGSIAYASSYDTVGAITKNTEDNAIITKIIAGKDEKDATTSNAKVESYDEKLNQSIKGKKIGLPKEYFTNSLDESVRKVIEIAIEKFKKLGCEIVEISLPLTEYAIAAYYVIGISEASSNLARFDGVRYGNVEGKGDWKEQMKEFRGNSFGDEEKRRIILGTYALSSGYIDQYYHKAQKVRQLIKKDLMRALNEVDIILTPTMPVLAPKIAESTDDPLKLWLMDAYTVSLNPTGLPGLSINAGFSEEEKLPVGIQLIGKHFQEEDLFNFAYQYEKAI